MHQLDGLLKACYRWFAYNQNTSVEFYVDVVIRILANLSVLRYGAVTVEALEAEEAFKYILQPQQV